MAEDEATSPYRGQSQAAELEAAAEGEGAPLSTEAYYSLQHCDSASLSSFSLDTPSLPRKLLAQEDTDSLVSTGTLVPEAIYLPPAGHRLVTHSDWDALNAQVVIFKPYHLFLPLNLVCFHIKEKAVTNTGIYTRQTVQFSFTELFGLI